jgi:hypothetical protein
MLQEQSYTYLRIIFIYTYIHVTINFARVMPDAKKQVYVASGAEMCMVLKIGPFGNQIRNAWEVLKCGAGEGWARSVGSIVWKMKTQYVESGGKEYSMYKKKRGRLTELATS